MKLIIGLGNPGLKYEKTRHNCGFMVMDKIEEKLNVKVSQNKFKSLICTFKHKNEQVILVKPQTYMNLSGEAVIQVVNYYKINKEDILVIHDDLDLPVGKIRIRTKGSAGGQKGMKNIIDLLHTQDIPRIRIGIDNDKQIPTADYVLGKVKKEDLEVFENSIETASEAAIDFISNPIEIVMSRYNKNGQ
ncbi:MAG: aminoacyl-tRNA hydrolase [Erysipelotrichaceae bacterium]|nr:aminoacyl-tRNA hydrolase [Erysipelotrichaceae bacterium]